MSCKCDTINIINDNNIIVVSHADGRDGKSAYQQAVEGGYTGTEQEFNCSLSLLADVKQVKENLVDAIEYKGGTSSADKSFQGIAEDIREIPNFNTNGVEYSGDESIPTTLLEALNRRSSILEIVDDESTNIDGDSCYSSMLMLEKVKFTKVTSITGLYAFQLCKNLKEIDFPELRSITGSNAFDNCGIESYNLPKLEILGGGAFQYNKFSILNIPSLLSITSTGSISYCNNLQEVIFENITNINDSQFARNCPLKNIVLGRLVFVKSIFFTDAKILLRNITIGVGTDINLQFQNWTATNVINEGQSGIDELNSNLRTNLLEKLADHSQDGQTRTLRLGWLAKVSQENIDYANSKGWTLTT
jgi:hypothetical protein